MNLDLCGGRHAAAVREFRVVFFEATVVHSCMMSDVVLRLTIRDIVEDSRIKVK